MAIVILNNSPHSKTFPIRTTSFEAMMYFQQFILIVIIGLTWLHHTQNAQNAIICFSFKEHVQVFISDKFETETSRQS